MYQSCSRFARLTRSPISIRRRKKNKSEQQQKGAPD